MKIKKIKFNKMNNNRGFTLVETMVAVFILTVALVSLLTLTSKSLFAARYARNEMTVNYLSQEAFDFIRNKRDSVAFQESFTGGGWSTFLSQFGYPSSLCFSDEGCYFDVNNPSLEIEPCTGSDVSFGSIECPAFNYDSDASGVSKSFYTYEDVGTKSNFKRRIKMEESIANPGDEVYITVTMEWLNGELVRTQSFNISLTNWLGVE